MSNLPFGHTRTAVTTNHALIAPDGHVVSPLTGWEGAEGVVLISPVMNADRSAPRFTQYLVHGSYGAMTQDAADGVERLAYVLEGEVQLDGQELTTDSFAFLPPGDQYQLQVPDGATLLVFEKRYEPRAGTETPQRITGHLNDAPGEPFLGDPDAVLATLLPVEPAFDMAVNVFQFNPGATLPFVETHVMEHGLYMRSGQGVYRLGDYWYPVREGDSIWMASYCPQWFVAMGKQDASYIYYKDIHRDPLSTHSS